MAGGTRRQSLSYAESDAALTAMKKDPDLAFLSEVSSVPLAAGAAAPAQGVQRVLRRARPLPAVQVPPVPAGRALHPQRVHYARRRAAAGQDGAPLRFVWSWPDVNVTTLNPAMVIVSREPDGRWYVTFTIDTDAPEPLQETGHAIGVDLGVTDFAVTSDGERIANPRHLERKARSLARYQRRLARCQKGLGQPGQGRGQGRPRPPQGPQRATGLPAPRQHQPGPQGRSHRDRRPRGQEHGPQPAPGSRHLGLRLGRVPPPVGVQVRAVGRTWS